LSNSSNSSTASKSRQHLVKDVKFAQAFNRIVTTGQVNEDYKLFDGWKREALQELNSAVLENSIDTALEFLAKLHPQLAAYIAAEDQDQQAAEDHNPDFTIGKSGKKVFTTLSMDDLENLPDIEYLVSGLLQTSTVSMMFAESNTGKTYNAMHLALCVAYGIPWLGRRVKQGPVLYIYAEGKLGMKPRIQAWKKHHDKQSTPNIRFIARPVHLIENRQELLDTIAEQEITPVLVVIDPYSMCAIGTNQNDQTDVTNVLSTAHEITRLYGCHVMNVHHSNRTGSINGSAAFKNHVDTMIELSREGKDGPITLRCEKQRDAEYFSDIKVALQVVDLGINMNTLEPVTSCVVVASSAATSQEITAETTAKEREQMLGLLQIHKRLSVNKWIAACKDVGISKAAFYKHIPDFKSEKLVTWDDKGVGRATYFEIASTHEQETLDIVEDND
jgi:AAA domain